MTVRSGARIGPRRRLVEPATDHQHRVGVGESLPDGGRSTQAGHPEVEGVIVRDDVRSSPRRHHGHLEQVREAKQLGRRPRAEDAATGEDDGAPRRGEQLDHGPDVGVRRATGC
jgi:hypothetical protein